MNTPHEMLMKRIASIIALRNLRNVMDPASGVTLTLRRGPIKDEENEDPLYSSKKDWLAVESAEMPLMEEIIDRLIVSEDKSATFWAKRVKEDIDKSNAALNAFCELK